MPMRPELPNFLIYEHYLFQQETPTHENIVETFNQRREYVLEEWNEQY